MKRILPLLISLLGLQASAQWTSNPAMNTIVCNAPNQQEFAVSTTDGAGGTIVAWQDDRSGGFKIYAQRMNAAGVAQWANNGVLVFSQNILEPEAFIVSDGVGGAFVFWYRDLSGASPYNIYAQHIDASGNALWTANGVDISTNFATGHLNVIADGAGGFFIAYAKENVATDGVDYIYGQHFNEQGDKLWGASDLQICASPTLYFATPKMALDGTGGVYMTWSLNSDIYAQRVSSAGTIQWAANGIAVKTGAPDETEPQIVADGSGGAIIAWESYPVNGVFGTYAQKINAAGVNQWTTPSMITTTINYHLRLLADNGGLIVTWDDGRLSVPGNSNNRVYMQKLDAQGVAQWAANGIPLKPVVQSGYYLHSGIPFSNGDGYIYFLYNEAQTSLGFDRMYAQKINTNGDQLWGANGIAVATHLFNQTSVSIVADNNGGMIAAFLNNRDDFDEDVLVQNIHSDGTLGPYLSTTRFDAEEGFRIYPNPTQGAFTVDTNIKPDQIIVSDLLGKEVLRIVPTSFHTTLQMGAQAEGVYFVKLVLGEEQTVKKIIIN